MQEIPVVEGQRGDCRDSNHFSMRIGFASPTVEQNCFASRIHDDNHKKRIQNIVVPLSSAVKLGFGACPEYSMSVLSINVLFTKYP